MSLNCSISVFWVQVLYGQLLRPQSQDRRGGAPGIGRSLRRPYREVPGKPRPAAAPKTEPMWREAKGSTPAPLARESIRVDKSKKGVPLV